MSNTRIHPHTIDAVKERVDIVDVVSEHIVLKKKGKEFVGICPFHDDTKPSMTVSPAKQFYYCFSCGAGGNAIKFLMEFQRQSFTDVVLELAAKYQVPIETLEGPHQQRLQQKLSRREELYKVMAIASGWFASQLRKPEAISALNYLRLKRHLSEGTILNFEIGYAPDKWDYLLNYLQNVQNFSIDIIEASGLVVSRRGGSGFYDRFRNRIIVPIHDRQKRVVAFGGRTLDGSDPKYLNSPESDIFQKRKLIFGLDKASSSIRKEDSAIVVEGYFDVISLHEAGITNTVASLGTALSNYQITQLSKCTNSKKIILNFDSDNAGIMAANRVITEVENLAMQGHLDLRVLHLPSGKDPDEFLIEHSSAEYKALIEKAPIWLDWQIDQSLNGLDLNKSDQFQLAVTSLVQLLGKLPQTAIRTHYLQKVSERLSGGHGRLARQLEEDLRKQVKGQRWHGRSQKYEKVGEATLRQRSESDILFLYIHSPENRVLIRQELRLRELEDFAIYQHRLLWLAITNLEESHVGVEFLESIVRGAKTGEELVELDLPNLLLNDSLANNPDLISTLTSLLQPGEFRLATLPSAVQELQGALAVLERQKSLKRCRHLIEAWSSQRVQTLETCIAKLIQNDTERPNDSSDMESLVVDMFNELNIDALTFQELYYAERKHIRHLDQQRCSSIRATDE